MAVNESTCALSAETKAITHSLGPATIAPPEDFFSAAHSPYLAYTDFSSSIIPRPPYISSSPHHSSIFECISHPYNADAFERFLLKHGLADHYPLLVSNLRHGFPLGRMPVLSDTSIIPNNPSIYGHLDVVDEYLRKEISSGRMSGPFSREQVELILRGPFQSSPIVVSVQPQEPGAPDKLRICRHLSKASKSHASMNSYMRKDEFPTCFDMASKIANIVSIFYSVFPTFSSHQLRHYASLCVSFEGCFISSAFAVLGICISDALPWTSCPLGTHLVSSSCLEHTPGVSRDILSS